MPAAWFNGVRKAARTAHGCGPLCREFVWARPGPARAASLDDYLAISEEQELALGKELAQQILAKLSMLSAAS